MCLSIVRELYRALLPILSRSDAQLTVNDSPRILKKHTVILVEIGASISTTVK